MRRKILRSLIGVLVLALTCIYALPGFFAVQENGSAAEEVSASFNFDKEDILRQLKEQNISAINKDLIKTVDENKLTGAVDVIVTLSQGSLVQMYNNQKGSETLAEYLGGAEAQTAAVKARERQNALEEQLVAEGLASPAKYHYSTILDGFAVTTTYENLSKLAKHSGVFNIILSDTYKPQVAVENPVKVYETGIFQGDNPGGYTGKRTIVAILDTGCDYAHPAFTTHQVEDPLYNRDDIARLLPNTLAYREQNGDLAAREVYYGNLTKDKIAFGYDYADHDPDVMPFTSEHGTHVAGIIGGYADESIYEKNNDYTGSPTDTLHGVAIDTQFAIMKVFSDYYEGAKDEDIMAALEDCVNLNVDAINMSLGSSCGFTREADDDEKNRIYDSIEAAGISLIVAASNDYSSAFGSEFGNTNKVENPDSGTVGAPSTYPGAMAVASINGNKDKYLVANGEREVFFLESADNNSKPYDFFKILGITNEDTVLDYVTVPGLGSPVNYTGLNVKDKVALVKRGDLSFEDKMLAAYDAGAKAVIIYNNVYGDITMTVGNDAPIPVISIGKDDGDYLAGFATGTLVLNRNNEAGPFMSDFSSWGPNPDLKIKPEITAHGGNIWSAMPGGSYAALSGTSMACPNMCGLTVLIRQYVKDNFPNLSAPEVRDMVNRLCMSTATIARNQQDNPYSPRKQGAGIADITNATTTKAYLYVEGISTTKLELGDDPTRTGVYEMSFKLCNISNETLSYQLGNYTMTEGLSADKKYVSEKSYLLAPDAEYTVEGAKLSKKNVVTVEGGKTATVTVKLTLSKQDKLYLNDSFPNGMYVEGFVTLASQDGGVDLNAPFLAFYGDWAESPIFDKDFYLVETEAHNAAIDDDDKIKADYYATTPYALYYYDYILPMGMYLYDPDPYNDPIPATREHAALSYFNTSLSGVYAVYAGLLRSAKELKVEVVDSSTGNVVWTMTDYNCYKAHYSGGARPYVCELDLSMIDPEDYTWFGVNNAHYDVNLTAKLDWDGERNISDTFSFGFYVDYEAPTITGANYYTKYNNATRKTEYYVDLEVYDNHYAMSVRPTIMNYARDESGNVVVNETYGTPQIEVQALSDAVTPVYQEARGTTSIVTIELTNYLENIRNSDVGMNGIMFQLDDYALNTNVCYVPFPETENGNLEFGSWKEDEFTPKEGIELKLGEVCDLTQYIGDVTNKELTKANLAAQNKDFLFMLDWGTNNENIVSVHNGVAEAIGAGETTVFIRVNDVKKSLSVKVVDEPFEDAQNQNRDNAILESIFFSGYRTKFAFNNDIDPSDIGQTNDYNYFEGEGDAAVEMYPSEKIQLSYSIKPFNLEQNTDRYTLRWISTNPNYATVDEKTGVVEAKAEGSCAIELRITVDGRQSPMRARCYITVKSEFIIDSARTLVAYKGVGGEVTIPDDEGIMYIGSFAFCHYNLDNEKILTGDDEHNVDLKKDPIGNNTVTKVIIPDTVTTIDNYAFYNCKLLEEVVVIGDELKTIGQHSFEKCEKLRSINLDSVNLISDSAFKDCYALNDVGSKQLGNPYALGISAFENCRQLKSVTLTNLRRGGTGCFKGTTTLAQVTLGASTRLSESMFENSGVNSTQARPLVVNSDIVPARAFYNCRSMQGVQFTRDVTYVGDQAFYGCNKLLSVVFNGLCEEFGTNVFGNCSALATIKAVGFEYENGIVFEGEDHTRLLMVTRAANVKNFTLPASVEEIGPGAFSGSDIASFAVAQGSKLRVVGDNAFANCADLTQAELPASVEYIGNNAFAGTALRQVDLSATKIAAVGNRAFYRCTGLRTVNLPQSCTTIGESAFEQCTSLSTVNLQQLTNIGRDAFYNTALTSVELPAENVVIGDYAFSGRMESPTALSNITSIKLGKGAQIGEYAFALASITQLTLDGEGTTVGYGAFSTSDRLQTADLSGVVGTLGDYAFANCKNLVSVDMPHVTGLGMGAFYACIRLKQLQSPELVTIGDGVFYPETTSVGTSQSVSAVVTPQLNMDKVESIGSMAFYYSDIASLDMPNVRTIGDNAFYGCEKLTKVVAPELLSVDESAFGGCISLESFEAPKLQKLYSQAFIDTAIKHIDLTENFEYAEEGAVIGNDDFEGFTFNGQPSGESDHIIVSDGVLYLKANKGLILAVYPTAKADEAYTVLEGTVRVEFYSFAWNENLQTVTLPSTLTDVGDYAFYACTKLSKVVFRSYFAPTLEGTATAKDEIYSGNVYQYPGFNDLYKFDFYYRMDESVSLYYGNLFSYSNFLNLVTKFDKSTLAMEIPSNSEGYDAPLYKAFFAEPTVGEATTGRYAVEFINAVKALPTTVDRYASAQIEAVRAAFASLSANNETGMVDKSYIDLYNAAVRNYNVDVARNAIVKLYAMDASSYSYNGVKNARALYDALTEEEKAQLDTVLGDRKAADVLETKTQELKKAMGVGSLDFDKDYSEYKLGSHTRTVTIAVAVSVSVAVVAAAAAVTVVLLLRKKRHPQTNNKEAKNENQE